MHWETRDRLLSSLVIEPPPDAREVTISFDGNSSVRLRVELRRCDIVMETPLGGVFRGAAWQSVTLRADCGLLDDYPAGAELYLVATAANGRVARVRGVIAHQQPGAYESGMIAVDIRNVPADLADNAQWHLEVDGRNLGSLGSSTALSDIRARSLEAHYGYPELEALAGGPVSQPSGQEGPGFAVVDTTTLGVEPLQVLSYRGAMGETRVAVDPLPIQLLPRRLCDPSTGTWCDDSESEPSAANPLVGVVNHAVIDLPSLDGLGVQDAHTWCVSSADPDVQVVTPDRIPLPTHLWSVMPNGSATYRVTTARAGPVTLFVRAVSTPWTQCGGDLDCWRQELTARRAELRETIEGMEEASDAGAPAPATDRNRAVLLELRGRLDWIDSWLTRTSRAVDVEDLEVATREAVADFRACRATRSREQSCSGASSRLVSVTMRRIAELEARVRMAALARASLGMLACSQTPLADLRVTVGSAARVESVPLPIGESLALVCESRLDEMSSFDAYDTGGERADPSPVQEQAPPLGHVARDGDIVAPGNVDDCRLVYEPPLRGHSMSSTHRLRLYGRQLVRVRIRARDQAEPVGEDVVFEPLPERRILTGPLRFPLSGQQQDDFIVTATIAVRRPDVPYRQDAVDTQANGAAYERGVYRYVARVRPRGIFGNVVYHRGDGFRFFVTVPIGVGAMRLPASPIDLESSLSDTSVSFSTLRTGVLLVAEPWDYRVRQNPTFIGLQAQAGLLLQSALGDIAQAPSIVYGMGISLPLVQEPGASQVGVSANLSFLVEHDLRNDGQPHFLMLFSANVLTLLSPQQGGPETASSE
ncbi:MAG: hypothetical protein VYE22_24230 [Myxococcota bacterium]|nr:hypothetical protein [Myxococcota bacterium]